ncbi:hypothetical protein JZ751_019965 [Albula glossodonta]|uniref:Beta-N-acetylhexosaminidase n=1 Tax=Albula glossodonta TaxID=121402 RepID=A0A8T2MST2_9TELE|nr:hypothetical protein JZ751_019965 [Albula glossodonta]
MQILSVSFCSGVVGALSWSLLSDVLELNTGYSVKESAFIMYRLRGYNVLKLVAFCLLVVMAMMSLSQPRPRARKLEPEPKEAQKDISWFWADGPENPNQTDHQPAGGGPQEPKSPLEKETDTLLLQPPVPKPPPLRVVHLDLKGAAPKITYLEQIFPLFSSLGATGVLLEYEDMFPYDGELKVFRSPYAYSVEDIRTIRDLAQRSNLQIIPLVHVFGHLEFVLKHEQYHSLREVADYPNNSGLHNLASPMIRFYNAQLDLKAIDQLITTYQDVGFSDIWFASAFKGASGIDRRVTPLSHHLNNHLSWLKVIASMPNYPYITFRGIVLMGSQRYDHFTVLCDLLPVGIPSLAICLQTLQQGEFSDKAKKEIQNILGCSIQINKGVCEGSGAFSGSEVYNMVLHIDKNLKKQTNDLMKENHVRGSFTYYHRKYNFANPRNLRFFTQKLNKLLVDWESFLENFRKQMEVIYFPDAVEEWMDQNVNHDMDHLREMANDADRIEQLKGRPKSQ